MIVVAESLCYKCIDVVGSALYYQDGLIKTFLRARFKEPFYYLICCIHRLLTDNAILSYLTIDTQLSSKVATCFRT